VPTQVEYKTLLDSMHDQSKSGFIIYRFKNLTKTEYLTFIGA
jgi:hypothetical protein